MAYEASEIMFAASMLYTSSELKEKTKDLPSLKNFMVEAKKRIQTKNEVKFGSSVIEKGFLDLMDEQKTESLKDLVAGISAAIAMQEEAGTIAKNKTPEIYMTGNVWPKEVEKFRVNAHGFEDYNSADVIVTPVGRNVKLAVKERNSGKFVGFIRLGSPVINCRPRNELLGQVFTQNPDWGKRFNDSAMMGFVIVPSQPFGYNYLGGKLLAAICCSHTVREIVNKKYGMNLCLFETTSLYGSSKSSSQYDGMKPYIRYQGLTESDFLPMMHGKPYSDLVAFVESKVGKIVDDGISSRKLKISMKIISLTGTRTSGG